MNTIILIGGLPRCGKSSLAHILMKHFQIPYYSTDILAQLINGCFSESHIDVDAPFVEKVQSFEPVLRMLVKTLSYQKGTFAIEGDVITPALIAELKKVYNIRACIFGSIDATVESYRGRTGGGYDWISERSDREVEDIVSYVKNYSSRYKDECEKLGVLYHELDSERMEEELQNICEQLLGGG